MKDIVASFRMLLWMTLLIGGIYPLVCTGISRPLFHAQAAGSLVQVDGKVVGSSLIAQGFSRPQYFWPRPSAAGPTFGVLGEPRVNVFTLNLALDAAH